LRKLLFLGGGLVLLAIVAAGAFTAYALLSSDDPDLATEAPAIPTSAAGAATTPGATNSTAVPVPAGVQQYVIDSAQSTVKYVVKENLRGVPDVTTVGTTSSITGDIYVSSTGLASTPKSSFKVDLTTLKTDNSMRDNYVRTNTLRGRTTAEFTIDSVTGFPTSYVEGTEVQLTLNGTLMIGSVSKPVVWQVKVRQAGDTLTATADTNIKMTDYGITPPDVGIAKAEDAVQLQVVFISKRAAG
jgi:polyisoprenoid-binding protein YceI